MTEEEASAGVRDQASKLKASEFHLSWNNYEASLASFLRLLSSAKEGEETALTDVTISCSGGKLFQVSHPHDILLSLHLEFPQAHRLVLATCSTYFRSLFVGRPSPGCSAHPIVYIPDLSDTVMEHLLAFMYRGETTVQPQVLLPLIEAAKLLGIQGLMDPGNIKQLLEQNCTNGEQEKLVRMEKEAKICNGKESNQSETVEDIISQELNNADEKKLENVKNTPDSSNPVFPLIPPSVAPVFPVPLPSPLALSLAGSQLALGLDLSKQFTFPQPKRRKSEYAARSNEVSNSQNVSPTNSGTSSNLINSSSGNGMFAHYPPTEDPSRPFGCSQCPKRFRMKHHLKEHMLIHSGEMPFSCHLCPKRFNRSYTLKNHMKLHSAGAILDKFQPACST